MAKPLPLERAAAAITPSMLFDRTVMARAALAAALDRDELVQLLAAHPDYVDGECTGCGGLIGMLPDEDPLAAHQADLIEEWLLGGPEQREAA